MFKLNVDIINFVIDVVFKASAFYFLVISIQEVRVLKHYLFESELDQGLGLLLLTLDTLFKMIIYFCIAIMIMWAYFNFDIFLSIGGGSLIDLV